MQNINIPIYRLLSGTETYITAIGGAAQKKNHCWQQQVRHWKIKASQGRSKQHLHMKRVRVNDPVDFYDAVHASRN